MTRLGYGPALAEFHVSFQGFLASLGMTCGGIKVKQYYVYIMASPKGTLYTGVTNNLKRRVYEHKHKLIEGFTKKYNVVRLVYCQETPDIRAAIAREKQIKGWRRSKKLALIKSVNPEWQDLSDGWYD